jgi:hypothetical protein
MQHVGAAADRRRTRVTGNLMRRLATVATAALLGTMLLGTATVSASTPGWAFQNQLALPTSVTPGADAGYSFTIANTGKSNISQLYLTDSVNAAPSYFSNSRNTVCQQSPTLLCAFGALNAGDHIDVVIAYTTPTVGSTFAPIFQINGTGVSFTDANHSHGDTKSTTITTSLNANAHFAGGFQIADGTTYTTTPTLGRKSPQSSAASSSELLVPVTIEDGLTTFPGTGTDPCTTLNCLGDWASIHVGNGNQGPVKVTLVLFGKSVPNGATVDNIGFWHEGSLTNPITLPCSDASSIPSGGSNECVTVTLLGNGNYQIVAWLVHNGGGRGTYS